MTRVQVGQRMMTCDELRAFVLGLEGMTEHAHHGRPDFRRDGRIIVNLDEDNRTITIKLDTDEQSALVAAAPGTYSLPGGWARSGWTTISLEYADPDEVRALVTAAWNAENGRRR
jgi:hypothetical protein